MKNFYQKKLFKITFLVSLVVTASSVSAEPKRLVPSLPELHAFVGQYPGSTARLGQFVVSGGPEGDSTPPVTATTLLNNGHVYLWDVGSSAPGMLYRLNQAHLDTATNQNWSKTHSDLGKSVAINSSWIAMGAPRFNGTAGAVFFIPKQGSTTYAPQINSQYIPAPVNVNDFGALVALSQNYLVVSGEIGSQRNVYVYSRINSQWTLVKTIIGEGKKVSISPDDQTIAIAGGTGTRFYTKVANQHNWVINQTLPYITDREWEPGQQAANLNNYTETSVDLDNSSAMITYGDGVRFFEKNPSGNWQLTNEYIYQYNYNISGRTAVAISNNYALLGFSSTNTVSVFQKKDINRNGVIKKEWLEINNFSYIAPRRFPGDNADGPLHNNFGSSLDINNDKVVVAASEFWEKMYGGDQIVGSGTAYAFDLADIVSGAPLKAGNNQLKNGDFSAGLNNWTLLNNNGGNSSHSVDSSNKLKVIITNPGSIFWSVQEVQSVSTRKGAYELSAKVTSPRESNFVMNVGKGYGDYQSYCRRENIRIAPFITTPPQEVFCNSIPQDSNMRVDLNLGAQGTNTLTLDDIYFGPARVAGTTSYSPLQSVSGSGSDCYDQEVMPTGPIEGMINTKIVAKPCANTASQQFIFKFHSYDSATDVTQFLFSNKNGQYCLTKADNSLDVVWKQCTGSLANLNRNLWTKVDTRLGYFRLHWATDPNLCVTNSNGLNFVLTECVRNGAVIRFGADVEWRKPLITSGI